MKMAVEEIKIAGNVNTGTSRETEISEVEREVESGGRA